MEGISRFHHLLSPTGDMAPLSPENHLNRPGSFSSRLALRSELNGNKANSALLSGAKRITPDMMMKKQQQSQMLQEKPVTLKNHEKGNYMKPTQSFKYVAPLSSLCYCICIFHRLISCFAFENLRSYCIELLSKR